MRKTTKQVLSLITAAAISASAASALAADVTFNLNETSDTDRKAAIIKATYDDNGALESAEIISDSVDIFAGETTNTIHAVEEGARYFLWDSTGGMKPLADAVTASGETPTDPVESENPTDPVDDPTPTPTTPIESEKPTPDDGPIFEGDTVIKEWKFDFGAEGATPDDGFTLVTPDTSFVTNKVDGEQYGFLGIGEEDYKLSERYDGWATQKGQIIELEAGGGTGISDAIGVVGAGGTGENEGKDIYGNQADIYYPTRFALKVADDTYYRVRATVTTLDPTKDATVSLYTERKHPLYTEKTIAAGETYTESFSVRVTPIYYEKSDPKGAIADEMLTVGVLGENSALVSVEIQQVESFPTVWVLGDSTVTDGNTTLPFFLLQNYTGVGTGLTKYLRRDYAMVNEGEGGLNAADNNHYNMVASRIKAGDYMYVEYGHNHKNDGPSGYKSNLAKYYNKCHETGAKLLIVSPVQSVNSWNDTTKRWGDRFGPSTDASTFAGTGKAYVDEKIAGGATDIAFVDLTKTSVAFVDKVTDDHNGEKKAAMFYYYANKSGGTDASHPNDAGADNFAYCFFQAAQEVTDATQVAVLKNLLENMTTEQPTPISEEIMAGALGGDAWPQYVVPSDDKYPVVINDVVFNEDGTVAQVDVTTRAAEIVLDSYGIIIITIYNADGTEKGKVYAVDQVDNSTGYGSQTIVNFRTEPTGLVLEEDDTYDAIVVQAEDSNEGLKVVEGGKTYSAVYKPTDIVEHLITDEDGNGGEDFEFFGATYDGEGASNLTAYNDWKHVGSGGATLTLGQSGDVKYANVATDGVKNGAAGQGSFYLHKDLAHTIGTTGKYMISADMKYVSGGGMNVGLVKGLAKESWGTGSITAFTINSGGKISSGGQEIGTISAAAFTNVTYILDMDLGIASISVGGGDPVEYAVENYATTGMEISPDVLESFWFEANKVAAGIQLSNLVVAQLKQGTLPNHTLTVAANDDSMGSAAIKQEEGTAATETAAINTVMTAVATPAEGCVFVNWTDGDTVVSTDAEYTFRLRKTYTLTANFAEQKSAKDTADFTITADKASVKAADGKTVQLTVSNVVDSSGNEVVYTDADVTWSCAEAGVTVEGGLVTITDAFEIGENTTKNIAVTCKIGNIEKTYNVAAYSYAYYEDVSAGTNYTGAIMTIGGRDSIVFGGGNSSGVYTLSDSIALDKTTTINMDMAWSGANTCGQLRTLNFKDSSGATLFSMSYSWGDLSVGGTTISGAIAKDTWKTMTIEIDPATNEVKVTVDGNSATTTLASATDISKIELHSAASVPGPEARALGMSKIVAKQ